MIMKRRVCVCVEVIPLVVCPTNLSCSESLTGLMIVTIVAALRTRGLNQNTTNSNDPKYPQPAQLAPNSSRSFTFFGLRFGLSSEHTLHQVLAS